MSSLRGVDPFDVLWSRRTTVTLPEGEVYELLSIQDLVQAKKTQRDKDWPMLQRLIEAHYEEQRQRPQSDQIDFWLKEARTPELLIELAGAFPDRTSTLIPARPLLVEARNGNVDALRQALRVEEDRVRAEDREHWLPLRRELERLRHSGGGA